MASGIISALEKVTEGDKEFMTELSVAFILNFKEFEDGLRRFVDSKNMDEYRSILHKVKPSFLTLELQMEFDKLDDFGKHIDAKSDKEIEAFKSWATKTSEEIIDELQSIGLG